MIYETIVTTAGADGHIHIAPMGLMAQDGLWLLQPFKPSTTLVNVLATRCAVVNFADDVRVFAGCLTGRHDWPTLPAGQVAAPRLADALAHRELELERVEDDPLRPRLLFRSVLDAAHGPFCGFNRAQSAVIEAAILVSRLHMLPAEKIDAELRYLSIAIHKTAGPREREAWGWLVARIDAHRAEQATAEAAR